jgi:hypothetical protein
LPDWTNLRPKLSGEQTDRQTDTQTHANTTQRAEQSRAEQQSVIV